MARLFVVVMLLAGVCGCTTSKRTYDVTVRNELDKPATLWLTKDGPPSEEKWRSPEEIAKMKTIDDLVLSGVVVQPGKTASTGPVVGTFRSGTNGVLRVYVGQTTFA